MGTVLCFGSSESVIFLGLLFNRPPSITENLGLRYKLFYAYKSVYSYKTGVDSDVNDTT